tara:strand:- start:180 stop:1070 length:891 start_codon:yes stop_codon:yes gene_type:complete
MNCLPENIDSIKLIKHLREICTEVSALIKSYNNENDNSISFKNKLNIQNLNKGPVTEVDLKVSKLIIKSINNYYPNIDWIFLSEENDDLNTNKYLEKDWVWLIDPLDGTKDFIQETGEYAMHLSLSCKKKTVLGIVLIPIKNELWFYLEGTDTWLEVEGVKTNIKKYRPKKYLNEMRVLASKNHRSDDFENLLKKINPLKIIGMGSVGFKVTSLIKGDADLYISYSKKGGPSPKDWDMAAPEAILRGLGGSLTYIDGREIEVLKDNNYLQDGIIIGSLGDNHQGICDQIRKLINTD